MKYIYIPYNEHKTNTATPFITYLVQAGDFSVTSNLNSTKITNSYNVFQNVISYTLADVQNVAVLPSTTNEAFKNVTLQVNKKDLTSFIKYSSVEKNFLQALDYIYYNYPAAIIIEDNVNGTSGFNILNVSYNPITNRSSFVVNTNFLYNPLDINYLNIDLNNREKFSKYRNLKDWFGDYEFEVDGEKYRITNFQGAPKFKNSFMSIEVEGKPFEIGNHSKISYISPSTTIKTQYTDNSPLFVSILMRNEKEDGFYIDFKDSKLTDRNYILEYNLTIIFPKTDKYNVDLSTFKFDTFKEILINYAKKQDEYETNLVLRKYVEPNLFLPILENFESTENQGDKLEVLLSVYAFGFDEQYKFVNSLKNINILTYDGEDNMPIELLDYYISSHGIKINQTLPLEKKKELGLVLTWLVKSKGTRAAVEFIFDFFNIPKELINFKEHIKKISGPIDVTLLKQYLNIIYGNDEILNISVDEDGYPKYRSNYIFEDSDYWSQFYVLDENLNGKYKTITNREITQTSLYEYGFEGSGTTFDYYLAPDSCYFSQSGVVDDVLKETLFDECGCEIENNDQALQIHLEPKILYSGCTGPIIDVWQECIGPDEIKLNVKGYGGIPPYIFHGANDGDIFPVNQPYSVYIEDSIGCESLTLTGTTYCYIPECVNNPIIVSLSYVCNYDLNGNLTGDATVLLSYSGGTAPYIVNGNENGDLLPNGETIAVEVIDALGCTSGIITRLIECNETPVECDFIQLDSTGECVSNLDVSNTRINVTYSLDNVPFDATVDTVVMTITKGSGGTGVLIGNVITEIFNNENGVKAVYVDFTPRLNFIDLDIDIVITLSNGCEYTDNYSLRVNCTQVNVPDSYSNILT
jgi:hypothetical protein